MIKVILKPEKGIQIDETKKYLFDPSVVQPYVDASAENATKAEEQANRAEQTFANVSAFVDTSKSEITGIIEQGKTEITTAIDDGRVEISDSILEATEEVKKVVLDAAQEAVQSAGDEATRIATEQVNTYVVEVVSPQIQEFVSNAEADASNAAESAGVAAEEANKSSVFASDSQHYAEDSRIWAEGEQTEVQEIGGELSSKGWANEAQASASAAKTSETNAKTSETNAKNYAESIDSSAFVKTTGNQTIGGNKTFTGVITQQANSVQPIFKSTGYTKGTAPSGDIYMAHRIYRENGSKPVFDEYYYIPKNTNRPSYILRMQNVSSADATGYKDLISAWYDGTNSQYSIQANVVNVPTPQASDNSTRAATTAWVRSTIKTDAPMPSITYWE